MTSFSQDHHHPDPNTTDSNHHPPNSPKPLDLDSYFDDSPDQTARRSKPTSISRPVRKALRLKGTFKTKRRSQNLTVPPSRDENEEDEWVREKWNRLLDQQKSAEAQVRRSILNRDRLDPLELSRWLDSDDTCNLPLPNLGVRLRMIDNQQLDK